MNALISVIIPIYNVENYLARCLESVINQTYTNLEIILVDDGSPDNSVHIAEEYMSRDSRIKLIHQKNMGASEARNTGLAVARGEYIAFVDSDDWLELDAYEHLLEILVETDSDMSVGGIRRTEKVLCKTSHIPRVEVLSQKEFAKAFFKIGSQATHYYLWNKLYRRDVVIDFKQPKGFYAEDVPSTFEYILKSKNIVVSDKIIYNYFINQESLTAKFNEQHFDVLKAWNMVIEMAEQSADSDYLSWAIFNRKRANFAILAELALSSNYQQLKVDFKPRIDTLIRSVREDRTVLLKAPIPLSRKALILAFSLNFDLTAWVLYHLKRLR